MQRFFTREPHKKATGNTTAKQKVVRVKKRKKRKVKRTSYTIRPTSFPPSPDLAEGIHRRPKYPITSRSQVPCPTESISPQKRHLLKDWTHKISILERYAKKHGVDLVTIGLVLLRDLHIERVPAEVFFGGQNVKMLLVYLLTEHGRGIHGLKKYKRLTCYLS